MSFNFLTVRPGRGTSSLNIEGYQVTAYQLPEPWAGITGSARKEREELVMDRDLAARLGVDRRRQIRLTSVATGATALYTLMFTANLPEQDAVYLGPSGYARLGQVIGDFPFEVTLTDTVVTSLSIGDADTQGEITEDAVDNGTQSDFLVIAPQGGDVEQFCSEQAIRTHNQMVGAGNNSSYWVTYGFTQAGDPVNAFQKWHITSTDIYPPSWPELQPLSGRNFAHAVSYHGLGETDVVKVGGSASSAMKADVITAIEGAVGPEITVEEAVSGDIEGDSPRNITNRLSPNNTTIQLEQSFSARNDYGTAIADAIANYYDTNIFI